MLSQDRKTVIAELDEFINHARPKLKYISDKLGWSEKGMVNENSEKNLVTCCHNVTHHVSKRKLKEHEERCRFIVSGYSRNDVDEAPPSSKFFYDKLKSVYSITIDKKLQDEILNQVSHDKQGVAKKIVPLTPKRAIVQLKAGERLTTYDYVVRESQSHINREEITADQLTEFNYTGMKRDDSDGPKSRLELLAEQRDYKRRRQSYRAKNVHITKRSHTEVIREVIANQVQSWERYLEDVNKESNRAINSRRKHSENERQENNQEFVDDNQDYQSRRNQSREKQELSDDHHGNCSRHSKARVNRQRKSWSRERRSREKEIDDRKRKNLRSNSQEKDYRRSRSKERKRKRGDDSDESPRSVSRSRSRSSEMNEKELDSHSRRSKKHKKKKKKKHKKSSRRD